MQIQTIGDIRLMIYVTRRELRRRGLDPEDLELRDVIHLTGDACREVGIPVRRTEEIEAYPERGGVLVFVHLKAEEKEWFHFPTLGSAMDAVTESAMPDGELAHWNGRYYISAHAPALRLKYSEFGEAAAIRECGAIEENAALVLDKEALCRLWVRLQRR